MDDFYAEDGFLVALLERFRTQRLPRVLSIKGKVDRGERLNAADNAFVERVFADAQQINALVSRHPEYEDLAAQSMRLYNSIASKALENERHAIGTDTGGHCAM